MPSTRRTTTKKSAAKKPKRRTAPRKKVAKKSAKKTVKKTVKKKTSSKTTAKPKRGVTQGESKNVKLLPKLPTSITLRNRMSLVALSPYRLPLDMERVVLNGVRVAGLSFGFVAGVLSFMMVQPLAGTLVSLNVTPQQSAEVYQSLNTDATDFISPDANLQVGPFGLDGSRSVSIETKPAVTAVTVLVQDVSSQELVASFPMQLQETDAQSKNWSGSWHTATLPSGRYTLSVLLSSRSLVGLTSQFNLSDNQLYLIGFGSNR